MIIGLVSTLEIRDGKRFCILCRDELIGLTNDINVHPIPCQQELDAFVPEKITAEFPVFFHRLTGFKLSPSQEQMFLHVEGKTNSYISARCTGKTIFLLVYTVYKSLETNERYGAVFHNRGFENQCNKLLKKMYIRLTDEERMKLDIHIEYHPVTGRIRVYGKRDPKADTFFDQEIRETYHYQQKDLHSDFTQWSNIRPMTPGCDSRLRWHMIFDPLY